MNKFKFLFALLAFLSWSSLIFAAGDFEKEKMKAIERAFDRIKGCYWIKEDLLNPTFETENRYPPKNEIMDRKRKNVQLDKKAPLTSMITGIYDSHVYFHFETKRPMKEVYLSLMPGNTHPGRSFQLIIDPDSYGVKGQEIRGNFTGPVLDRSTAGKTAEELEEEAKKPEEPTQYRQEFVATGQFSDGIRILVNSAMEGSSQIGAVASLYSYVLKPAKRQDCVNEEIIDHGLPEPDRKFR